MTRQEISNLVRGTKLNLSARPNRTTADLQLLSGMDITDLTLSDLKYASEDFAALNGLPLERLALQRTNLTRAHFAALKGVPINELCLRSCTLAARDDLNEVREALPLLNTLHLRFTRVSTPDFSPKPVPINLEGLSGLPLSRLSVDFRMTEEELVALQTLPLRELDLTNTDLRESDLTPLRGLRQLTKLRLYNTGWNGAGFEALTGLQLTELDLSTVKLKNLADLRVFPLRTLILSYLTVTPADLKALNQLPLTTLGLSCTSLTDFKELTGFPQLGILELSDTQVTGEFLKELDALPLTEIYLNGTPAAQDEDALAHFRAQHPNCSVYC